MLKTKQRRFAIVAILMIMMVAMYGGMPAVNAASMDSAKVTLSDSDLDAVSTATVVFDLGTALAETDYVNINFAAGFTDIAFANATCPGTSVASGADQDIVCTAAVAGLAADAPLTLEVDLITNPGVAGDYSIVVSSHHAGGAVIETSEVKVYVVDDVTVTAHVAASLTFAVDGVADAQLVNGDTTTGGASATALAYDTLTTDAEHILAQELSVSTNASAGYVVTVQQDGNMENAAASDIDSFNTAGPIDWAAPAGTLGAEATYGHMGVATDDSSYAGFSDGFYQGLDGTTPLPVMTHNGSADGSTPGIGLANVAYNIEITDLQEAGDYENTLTYVCTPTF